MENQSIGFTTYYTDPLTGKVIEGVIISANGGWRAKAISSNIHDYYTVKLNQQNSSGCDTVIVLKGKITLK